tara:strand:+ start:343 stop:729 length:387 start_codon:yes stop_codon:yes gene_type:complete
MGTDRSTLSVSAFFVGRSFKALNGVNVLLTLPTLLTVLIIGVYVLGAVDLGAVDTGTLNGGLIKFVLCGCMALGGGILEIGVELIGMVLSGAVDPGVDGMSKSSNILRLRLLDIYENKMSLYIIKYTK